MCANRLAGEKSPYLLQHAHNPVDWHPWGAEAFEEARRRDVPVFLSIGYSTCHWCHVMERESFEREDVAQLLREHFVAIKVDREERPDLDDIYMPATQMMTGRGGWPNSLWLTPDGRPWFAGTYFPPEDRGGAPGFKTVLRALAQVWRERRDQVEAQAAALAQALRANAAGAGSGREAATREWAARVIVDLRQQFDAQHGGFGGAPKFPPHAALRLLLDEVRRGRDGGAMEMATATLDAMALGGIRDHVGGGFHRYATDERWFLPHFEKMLYDNALLIRAYAAGFALTGKGLYRAAAQEACDWVLREMTHSEGGFYSALDADSEGVEGRFHLWRRAEIMEALGAAGEEFCRIYGATAGGNYHPEHGDGEPGFNILFRTAADDGGDELKDERENILARRALRVRPHCDDKVLTDWNGMMIGALGVAGRVLGEPRYIEAAERAAGFVSGRLRSEGRLLHRWRDGEARGEAFLDDYACLADGLLDLHAATGTDDWLSEARGLADTMLDLFSDPAGGALYQTAGDAERLIARTKPCHDAATPSGNGVAARLLARLYDLTGDARYLRATESVLSGMSSIARQVPQLACTAAGAAALVADLHERHAPEGGQPAAQLIGPAEVVRARPGETVGFVLRLALGSDYHAQLDPSGPAGALPLALAAAGDIALDGVEYPPADRMETGGASMPAYRGSVSLGVRVRVASQVLPGERWGLFTVEFRPCTDRECLPKQRAAVECRFVITRGESQ